MRSTAGIPARRNGVWSSKMLVCDLVGEDRLDAHALGRAPHLVPQRGGRGALAREPDALVADVVEQDHRPDLLGVELDVGLRAAQRVGVEVVGRRGLLLAVEEDEADARRDRAALHLLERAGQLDHGADRGGGVVGADEALGPVDGVVVGADDDHRSGPRQVADDVAQAGMCEHVLEAAVGQLGAQLQRDAAERRRARGARPGVDLQLGRRHRARAVEAVDGGVGHGAGALAGRQRLVVMVWSVEEREPMDGQRDQPTEEHQLADERDNQQLDREAATAIAVIRTGLERARRVLRRRRARRRSPTRRYRPNRVQSPIRDGSECPAPLAFPE